MASKNVVYRTVVITDIQGNSYTVADSATSNNGTSAFREFKDHETVKIAGENSDTYVPFHAILKAVVSDQTTTVEYTDSNCEAEGESE